MIAPFSGLKRDYSLRKHEVSPFEPGLRAQVEIVNLSPAELAAQLQIVYRVEVVILVVTRPGAVHSAGLIVGDGPGIERCRSIARAEKANVVFTGFRKDVEKFLSIADVFVLPSFSESLNYSLVEAAYMEVPVVCTDIGVISSDSALLVRTGDEKQIAEAIDSSLSRRDMKRERRAKEYAMGFDWGKTADAYIRIMGELSR